LKLSRSQQLKINEWIHTSRFVYNKTVACTKEGEHINFQNLRDKLVTQTTRKHHDEYYILVKTIKETTDVHEKTRLKQVLKTLSVQENECIQPWEYNTPKDIRAGAVQDVCKAYTTGFSQLKSGLIQYFNLGFKRKTNPNQCVVLPKNAVKCLNGKIEITYLKSSIPLGRKTKRKLKSFQKCLYDCRLVRQKGVYWLHIPMKVTQELKEQPSSSVCGIDPGCRTLMTVYGTSGITEYHHDKTLLKKLNDKHDLLKQLKKRKSSLNKIENRKTNCIDELHWKTIRSLLKTQDILFMGDIKSHSLVKNKPNKTLNRTFNDLKFHIFKQRLVYKALCHSKKVIFVHESFTSQTCSSCGTINKPGSSKIYSCSECHCVMDRDHNAAKCILMKGLLQ
jgi:putative transposase